MLLIYILYKIYMFISINGEIGALLYALIAHWILIIIFYIDFSKEKFVVFYKSPGLVDCI